MSQVRMPSNVVPHVVFAGFYVREGGRSVILSGRLRSAFVIVLIATPCFPSLASRILPSEAVLPRPGRHELQTQLPRCSCVSRVSSFGVSNSKDSGHCVSEASVLS